MFIKTMFKRLQEFHKRGKESAFLWGARQTGKSTLLKNLFPKARYYDLLLSEEFVRLSRKPSLLREELLAMPDAHAQPVIIDEVQKIPALLDEVHWLIVNKKISFILCGSSARKLKRVGANLLGGRALRYELYPLVSSEIPDFDLLRAVNNGCLPRHYAAADAHNRLEAYLGDYLKEEIASEALSRNIPAFAHFMDAEAFSNGEMVNYNNIASDCGVSAPTVKEYFNILEDTLIGYFLPVYQKRPKRRTIRTPKFYFFDVGIANSLLKRGHIAPGTELFGKAFEHLIFQEIKAHQHYSGVNYSLSYWRTSSGNEVDFILGDHEVAIEVKSTDTVAPHHLKGLCAFSEEYKVKKSIVVSLDKYPRVCGNVTVLPWKDFLGQLWNGKIIG